MDEQQFRTAVEAAVRKVADGKAYVRTTTNEIMDMIREHAADEYARGHADGMAAEREVHFG